MELIQLQECSLECTKLLVLIGMIMITWRVFNDDMLIF
jgi:hypothetical protein